MFEMALEGDILEVWRVADAGPGLLSCPLVGAVLVSVTVVKP